MCDLMKEPIPDEEITEKDGHNHWIMISALNQDHINELQHKIFEELRLIRVFLKVPGREADLNHPMILQGGPLKPYAIKCIKILLFFSGMP